jgi:hypothetical protein
LDNRDRNAAMSDTAIASEMQAITRNAAGPWQPGDSVKAAIGRAARTLGIGYRRARSFWYGEQVAVRAFEADRMRAAETLLLGERQRRLEHELAAIRARLDAADQEEAAAHAVVARREAGSGVKEPLGVKGRAWDALRDADRRRP